MNVVVAPDGCAELDGRETWAIGEEVFGSTAVTHVRLEQNNVVEGVAVFDTRATEENDRARRMVAALVGAHVVFMGTVVLAHLNPQDAIDLLTIE